MPHRTLSRGSFVLLAITTLLLAACTGDDDDPTATTTATPEATPTAEATSTASPTPTAPPATSTPRPAPRDPTFAPDGRTAIPELDALIEALLTADEPDLAALFDGVGNRYCIDIATGVEERDLAPNEWPALLAGGNRTLYSVLRGFRSILVADQDIVLAVTTDGVTKDWAFGVKGGEIVDLRVGCAAPSSDYSPSVSTYYTRFLVLPPVDDLPVAPPNQPLTVRTGDQTVDRILGLLEAADTDALLATVVYDTVECSETQGDPVRCEPAEDPDTPIDLLQRGSCTDPGVSRRSVVERELPRIVTADTGLHGVAIVPDGFRIDADHSILLVNQRQTPYDWRTDALYLRDGRIVAWDVDCGDRVNLLYPPVGYLVAPGAPSNGTDDIATGVAILDQAITAIAAADLQALTALVDWQLVGCLAPGVSLGIGQPPYCEGDEQPGDLIETLGFSSCEGAPVRRSDSINNLQTLLQGTWTVHAIADRGQPRIDSVYETRYQLVLVDEAAELAPVRSLNFSDDGLRWVASGCGATDPASVLRHGNTANFLLAPPATE